MFVVNVENIAGHRVEEMMKDNDIFVALMTEITKYSSMIRSKKITLSDYYFKMADFFNSIEPSKGQHMGNWFDFKNDAQDFKQLAIKELNNEQSR